MCLNRNSRKMEHESSNTLGNEGREASNLELLEQLNGEYVQQDRETEENNNSASESTSRKKRSIINAPPRQNNDGSPRYRRDRNGVLRKVYSYN